MQFGMPKRRLKKSKKKVPQWRGGGQSKGEKIVSKDYEKELKRGNLSQIKREGKEGEPKQDGKRCFVGEFIEKEKK